MTNIEKQGIWAGLSERQRRQLRVERARKPHGYVRYTLGCRCELCRAGWAEYQRNYQAQKAAR